MQGACPNHGRRPMASVRTTATAAGAAAGRPRARRGDDLAAALLGTWVVGGLFMDGWAHVNQPGLETFFSPWHAIFYAALLGSTAVAARLRPRPRPATFYPRFLVATVVRARLVARHQRGGGRVDLALVPAGYGLGLVGVA